MFQPKIAGKKKKKRISSLDRRENILRYEKECTEKHAYTL